MPTAPTDAPTAQRYVCACGDSRLVTEAPPPRGPQSIRIGCETCKRVTKHLASGSVAFGLRVTQTRPARRRGGR